ncbi:MAG: adenosine deaminase [Actinomycetota bacterium]|nr:adenosine deaminase [Actinomycetota bacterium]
MNQELLRKLPKAELHNHLDGGLRVETVIELAAEIGYAGLPTTDPTDLSNWFFQGESGSLETYLAGFEHTVAVMQTTDGIERVAYEAGMDLVADGIIYAEIRFAPMLNTRRGLAREDVLEAALEGLRRATAATGIPIGLIVDAMRDSDQSLADARAAVRFAGQGVVGFDLAGPEKGFPADDHLPACRLARDNGLGLTIHAGEADGPDSIHRAIAKCGADRIGHGIRIVDDAEIFDSKLTQLGGVASLVRDRQIPLEVCPTSNLHTLGIAPADHPLGLLNRAGFNVTLSTDNRLMSRISLTDEFAFAVEHHGFTNADLHRATVGALHAGFLDYKLRRDLLGVVDEAYAN